MLASQAVRISWVAERSVVLFNKEIAFSVASREKADAGTGSFRSCEDGILSAFVVVMNRRRGRVNAPYIVENDVVSTRIYVAFEEVNGDAVGNRCWEGLVICFILR